MLKILAAIGLGSALLLTPVIASAQETAPATGNSPPTSGAAAAAVNDASGAKAMPMKQHRKMVKHHRMAKHHKMMKHHRMMKHHKKMMGSPGAMPAAPAAKTY